MRLTEKEDMSTKEGLAYALKQVKRYADSGFNILLWGAIPCTGGSPWQSFNIKIPGVAAKIRRHIALYRKLFANFTILARFVYRLGLKGFVVNEWPERCRYWTYDEVVALRNELMPFETVIHGCSLGLKSIVYPDKFILKPWRLSSNSPAFIACSDPLHALVYLKHISTLHAQETIPKQRKITSTLWLKR